MGLKLSLLLRVYCLVLTGALAGAVSAADLQVEHVTIISAERTALSLMLSCVCMMVESSRYRRPVARPRRQGGTRF